MLSVRLRKNERCPLHGRRDCCGRGGINIQSRRESRKYIIVEPGVKRYPDGRERCNEAALKRRKHELLRTHPVCYACGEQFSDYREVELAHIESKGMNSWKRNDAKENLVLLCAETNADCGSRNLDEYMASVRAAGKKFPCEV